MTDHNQFETIQEMVNYLEDEYEIKVLNTRGHKNCGKSFIGERI